MLVFRSSKSCPCASEKCMIVSVSVFRNVHFFGEYLRESVDEEGLSACLFVNGFNDFWGKTLSDLSGILPKEFLYLGKREVGQREIVMDIEG